MKNISNKEVLTETDPTSFNLVSRIDEQCRTRNGGVIDQLMNEEAKLEVIFFKNGNIKEVLLNKKALKLSKKERLSLLPKALPPLQPISVWILVSMTTVVVCYLGYKAYKTIKKYINKKTKKKKTVEKIRKSKKKCGN